MALSRYNRPIGDGDNMEAVILVWSRGVKYPQRLLNPPAFLLALGDLIPILEICFWNKNVGKMR